MQHLIDAVRRSIREKNWYAALTGALVLPDIASKLDGGPRGSQQRYTAWYDLYLLPKYSRNPEVVLSGRDCYALRCAFLHEGEFDTSNHPARDVLDRFQFVEPPIEMASLHRNRCGNMMQLQIDRFCEDVCVAVTEWMNARGSDPAVASAIGGLPKIFVWNPNRPTIIDRTGVHQV